MTDCGNLDIYLSVMLIAMLVMLVAFILGMSWQTT